MERIKVLIADDIVETRNVIKKLLNLEEEFFEIIGEAGDGETVLNLIPKLKPHVVLMDINMPILNGLEATERINNEYPSTIVIIMSVQGENEYLKKAMFYGAKEYIIKPFNYDSLVNTIKITYEKYKNSAFKRIDSSEKTKDAKIITFYSSKGGVGKSVLALNSSVALSKENSKKVLLLDMDLQFGDISMMVNQCNRKTILDVIDDGQLDSYDNIKTYLYAHNENLHILFAPRKPEAAEYISKDSIEKIIKLVKKHYDVIIVDTGVNFSDNTLYVLDQSDTILFVSTMEITSLKNTKLGMGVMKSLGYDNGKVSLIINRFNTSYGISKAEVETAFNNDILLMLPEDEKTIAVSINQGKPFCDEGKLYKQKIVKSIRELNEILKL